jgi:aerobic-type carbon monoxide dehydrogenase small subunit (CoxS/CutS family)
VTDYQVNFAITLNGISRAPVTLPASWRLIDYLHEVVNLTGTKFGCGAGYCKACTVAARTGDEPWRAIPACSTSLRTCNGWEIITVEALGTATDLHPLQAAVIDDYAFQCGYCTPGFLMEGFALQENLTGRTVTRDELDRLLRGALDGHLCRCTGYQRYHSAFTRVLQTSVNLAPAGPIEDAAASEPEPDRLTTNPRWELIGLLFDAAEIEHGLLLQYLYATFSLKRPIYAGIAGSGYRAPGIPHDLLAVAIEEMSHLDIVNRLLVALGAAPRLTRRVYPWQPANYPFPFSLEPLSPRTLAKYTWVEAARGQLDRDPEVKTAIDTYLSGDLPVHRVGSIYQRIRRTLQRARAAEPRLLDWGNADRLLRTVQLEGEDDHYQFFRSLLLGTHPGCHGTPNPWALPADHPLHPVVNYQTNPTGHPGHPTTITGEIPRRLAMLANRHYWTTMGLLELSYRHNGIYHPAARRHMVGPLLQLGWHLAEHHGTGIPFDPPPIPYRPANDDTNQHHWLLALLGDIDTTETNLAGHLPVAYQHITDETRTELHVTQL